MMSSDDRRRLQETLDQLTAENSAELNAATKKLAGTIVSAMQGCEDTDDMWRLVDEMMNIDESLVLKLEFVISSCFIDRNLSTTFADGGRHAH